MAQRSKKTAQHAQAQTLTVRYYFDLAISCLIPRKPSGRGVSVSDVEWERRYLEGILTDLAESLGSVGADVAYREHARVDDAHRLYVAQISVSVAQKVEIATLGKSAGGSNARTKQLRNAAAHLESQIRGVLNAAWVVNGLIFEGAAAWDFVFEVTVAGTLELKRSFGQEEIDAAGGSVREAIEGFNDEIAASLEPGGFVVTPRNTARRAKDSIYKFDVHAVSYWNLTEREVSGNLSLMKKGGRSSGAPFLEVRRGRQSFEEHLETARSVLETHDFPAGADLVRSTLEVAGYDEDVVDCIDALVIA